MARGLPRRLWQMIVVSVVATTCCECGPTTPIEEGPIFDSLRVTWRGDDPAGHRLLEFLVLGREINRGTRVVATPAAGEQGAACARKDADEVNVTQIWAQGDRAKYAVILPRGHGNIYFCLPHEEEEGAWVHQGNVFIPADDPDLPQVRKQHLPRSRRDEELDPSQRVRVTGLRVDVASKDPHYDENGVPYLLSGGLYTIRLFGHQFTEQMAVTFTQQEGLYGGSCQIPSTPIFPIVNGSLTKNSVQVIVKLPTSQDDAGFYICVKEGTVATSESVSQSRPFVHQGNEPWLSIKSYEKMVPLWAAILIICICLCFSALFSGLNLGLMSLDRTELKILCNTGTPKERDYAKKIQPVRNHGNYLLCSILLGNVLVNSTFTILLDDLTSGLVAVICSTLAIVMFGEITPQAVCSRHGLAIGAKTISITKVVMGLTFPLAYPISKLLDVLLGEEIGSVYTRERLKELVKVTTGENDLDKDEVNIISGALELRKKTVADVMTKMEDAFMLSLDAILDFETVSEIMKSGFSRIPVYEYDRKNIVTTMYIKDLAFVDPDDNTPLKTLCQFYQNPCNFVFEDVTLDIMFKDFKEGNKGHMAFINRVNSEGDGDPFYETIGLITLEDVIEELIQAEIMDETDVFTDNRTKRRRNADKTKQDFTVFAERRGENNRIRISPQLTLATFQFLSTSIELFKPDMISETILRRLLKQDIIYHIKKNKDWRNDANTVIYQQGKPTDYFVLILEGRVEVTVGLESLMFESGPFTYFGTQALTQNVGIAAESPSALGSLQSLNMDSMLRYTFQPDYAVRACTEVLYMKVRRNLYMAAKRASLMERSTRDTNTDQFDDEVEKLLHSLNDDVSLGRNSPEPQPLRSNSLSQHASPRPSKSQVSPTTSGPGAFTGSRDLNGSIKQYPSAVDEALDQAEEEMSLLPKKS